MSRTIAIGIQDFKDVIENKYFYVDKTHFIKEWWENGDIVTLITRPRRFGKTLTMSMVEYFFSNRYRGISIFDTLNIWKYQDYRGIQGNFPVISLTFSGVKYGNCEDIKSQIKMCLSDLFNKYRFLCDMDILSDAEKQWFSSMSLGMSDLDAILSLNRLSEYLYRYYNRKVIILLDEYDSPMQEAYLKGYWGELSDFIRGLFNNTFKANQYLERAILTGVTRVSKESIFLDLNNLEVVSVTSPKYANVFGFTEDEVFQALDEFGFNNKSEVKRWYDGFAYGSISGIYNPWSILKYLDSGVLDTYWVNTSSNALISKSIQSSSPTVKDLLQTLLDGDSIDVAFDEQFVYGSLDTNESAIWGLLVSSGYLKIVEYTCDYTDYGVSKRYKLKITNYEVRTMFSLMIRDWFSSSDTSYPYQSFLKALISDNVDAMNLYMGIVIENTFSYFDVSGKQSERFYHGFVLGLITEFSSKYIVKSNRESGLGRYDVMLEPKLKSDNAIIIEFKVCYGNGNMRGILEDALHQIEVNHYDADLLEHGFGKSQIKKYGFVFRGKECLIGKI